MKLKHINTADFTENEAGFVVTNEQLAQLDEKLETLSAENAELSKANEDLLKKFDNLSASPAPTQAAAVKPIATLSFELDGQKYGFRYPHFSRDGVKITAEQIANDAALQAELVSKKHSILKQL
ncbi:MAG: hypothetical protein J0L83_14600 [Chitinophagales bacterium]|nr:hypothetical protein [Chitinophagales bacterium]